MEKLKHIREEKQLSIQEVANKLGISRITLWAYESGKRKPSFDTLIELSKIYGCKQKNTRNKFTSTGNSS